MDAQLTLVVQLSHLLPKDVRVNLVVSQIIYLLVQNEGSLFYILLLHAPPPLRRSAVVMATSDLDFNSHEIIIVFIVQTNLITNNNKKFVPVYFRAKYDFNLIFTQS